MAKYGRRLRQSSFKLASVDAYSLVAQTSPDSDELRDEATPFLGDTSELFLKIMTLMEGGGGGEVRALTLIGASLSEPRTSVTAFAEVVCMYVCLDACLVAAIYRKF